MNKKGFTLIELLAVIIILSLLAIIANNSVTNVISNSKSDLYDAQIKLIQTAAQNWGVDNLNKLPETGNCSYILLKDLKDYGMFEDEIINPKTNEEFSDDLVIKITSKTNNKGELVSNYEVSPNNIKDCNYAYPPVCTLINDADSSGTITAGDVYNCKVKEDMEPEYPNGYTFYILTTPNEKDESVNLIMNQNINSDGTPAGMNGIIQEGNNVYNLVAWNLNGTNTEGPITAIKFLYNSTKSWVNIPALNYEYKDRNFQDITENSMGYTSFISNNGVLYLLGELTIGTKSEPLRARMPIYSGTWNDDYTEKISEKGEVLDKNESNVYLYDNLDSNAYGYWTLSSFDGDHDYAWCVEYEGYLNQTLISHGHRFGVRPVIALPKRLIGN